jgi:Xaa-Pro aminopeptidase
MAASTHENVGSVYLPERMLQARERAWTALARIARRIEPGMREDDADALTAEILRSEGMDRVWHPSIVRFGANTLKTFRQRSAPETVLGADDIFFIDLGPVFDGHEGDVGDTFVTGGDPVMAACASAARSLFEQVAARWREGDLDGRALYDFAAGEAEAGGWRFNHAIKGHRIGDYPHAVHQAGALGDYAATPSPGLWVLEIQIAHPLRPIGAFYEDLLVGQVPVG